MARYVFHKPSRALSEYAVLQGYIERCMKQGEVCISTPLTAYRNGNEPAIKLNRPFLSAAMQAITGPKMAIALAQIGGMGVIYCSQPIEKEAEMIKEVKRYKGGFVVPDVFSPHTQIEKVIQHRIEKRYSTFPITEDGMPNGKLVGLLTKNDFDDIKHRKMKVYERMLPVDKLYIVERREINDDLKLADDLLRESHHGSLIIVDDGRLWSMVFKKDIMQHMDNPFELTDRNKRYMVGAAINTRDYTERVPELMKEEPDVLFVDTSHGYTDYVADAIKFVKEKYDIPVIGGNVVTRDAFNFLARAGADGVKVGMGPGSICITIEQIGVGCGQGTAIEEVGHARDRFYSKSGLYVPIISDGGVVVAKDVTVALALGADSVMMGRYFAGCNESNSPVTASRKYQSKQVKLYWAEGSEKARSWMEGRYNQADFPEGVVSEVDLTGSLKDYMKDAIFKIADGMRKAGCMSINDLHEKADLRVHSHLSIREAGYHDVDVVPEGDDFSKR
ncbi:MAG: IMP dehydrogenase [Candidatus Aenigmarchaeota archaeon]|nr:IMP dehydrogenase [Candidatus Aenigmarchaeota archaeon]MDI6722746.1 IMP dehydrogenase [Candidatus Aenigmarchaeota archaeon]